MARVIYDPRYNIGLMGLERLHPFDVRKFERAWKLIESELEGVADRFLVQVDRECSHEELLLVHSEGYLNQLRNSQFLAQIFEVPLSAYVPSILLDQGILQPMRWATRGTVIACEEALECGVAMNLGGGFHHAKPDSGEGFCVYSDIALGVQQLRHQKRIDADSQILYIDLDAHQGNGVCYHFMTDRLVRIYDQYNAQIYPKDQQAGVRVDCDVPLKIGCSESEYLDELRIRLSPFLDRVLESGKVGLAIFNAGTDVYSGDELGLLSLSAESVLQRDLFVIEQLRSRDLPTVILTSGGYTQESHRLIAQTAIEMLRRW